MTSLQHNTLQLYGELLARTPADGWAGKLILTSGPSSSSTGLPAAVCIAGATCLVLDPDTNQVRATFRDAGFDFIVNTLEEAVRVLKNEIRRGRPLAVALTSDPQAALAEASGRGLLPDLTVNAPDAPGRTHFAFTAGPTEALTIWLTTRGWTEQTLASGQTPPAFPNADPRAAWLRQLPRYQRSATSEPRLLWLDAGE